MIEDPKYIVFDVDTNEVLSPEEYKANQEKIKMGDPTAKSVRMVDKRLVVIENNKIIGTQRIIQDSIKAPDTKVQEYPTSISDFMTIEPQEQVSKVEKAENVDDLELFVNLVNKKYKERASAKPIESQPEASTSVSIPSNEDLIIKEIEREILLKKIQTEVDALTEETPIFDSSYNSVLTKSVNKTKKPTLRKHFFKYLPPQKVIAIALAAGMTFASINFARNAVINSNWYQNIQDNIEMTSFLRLMDEYDARFNDVNPNKITIPNSFDSYQNPKYWLDTDGVARDILNEGDKNFIAALYYAYYEMDGIRTVGEYHNWDNVLSSLSMAASEQEHPTAYKMAKDCNTFDEFLIKNGLVDENGLPSPVKFEELGKEALKTYSESLTIEDNNPNYGGRS